MVLTRSKNFLPECKSVTVPRVRFVCIFLSRDNMKESLGYINLKKSYIADLSGIGG